SHGQSLGSESRRRAHQVHVPIVTGGRQLQSLRCRSTRNEAHFDIRMSQATEAQAQAQSAAHKRNRNGRKAARRSYALIAALAAMLSLTACGGGGSADGVTFDIGVAV